MEESPRSSINVPLERKWQLNKKWIPQKVEKSFVLENIFGLDPRVVEKVIVRDLYTRLGLEFEEKRNLSFRITKGKL